MKERSVMKKIAVILLFAVGLILAGCSNSEHDRKSLDVDIFGQELYNASYASVEGKEVPFVIPVMSKIDLSKYEAMNVEYSGGTIAYEDSVDMYDYTYEGYKLYTVNVKITESKFEDAVINIDKISFYVKDNKIEIMPNKCELVKVDGIYSHEHVYTDGVATKLPIDMKYMPLELSADVAVNVKNIYTTNDSIKLSKFEYKGEISDKFNEFVLSPAVDKLSWRAEFDLTSEDLAGYRQYGCSVIIEYEYDGQLYYTVPTVPCIVYNPFEGSNKEVIESYYKKLLDELG